MPKSEEKFVNKKHQARAERERNQVRLITITAIAIAVIVIGLIGFAFANEYILKPSRAVAVVGSEKVTLSEFQTRVRYSRFQMLNQMNQYESYKSMLFTDESSSAYIDNIIKQIQTQLDDSQSLGQSVLDELIQEAIIKQEAEKRGITVSAQEIEQSLQEAYGYYANGTPTPTITPTMVNTPTISAEQLSYLRPTATTAPSATPDAAAPTAVPTEVPTLAPTIAPTEGPTPTAEPTATPYPTATPITLDGYKGILKTQVSTYKTFNFSEAELRKIVATYLLRDKMLAEITKDMKPEQDQVWARHILVATEDEAKAVYERVTTGGEDWYTVAAEVSLDTANKDNGGDLGWFGPGAMVKEFETAAYALEIGKISQPVQTENGWHIIQVIGHEVRPLTATEFQSAKEKSFSDWVAQMKTDLTVTTKDELWQSNIPTEPSTLVLPE